MRFFHTSDWHLGQTLHNFDRSYEHQAFLDWLIRCLVNKKADALLILGRIPEESEYLIVIGRVVAFSASSLDVNFAYAALGHLHRSKKVGNREHLH